MAVSQVEAINSQADVPGETSGGVNDFDLAVKAAVAEGGSDETPVVLDEDSELPPIERITPKRESDGIITYELDGKTYAVRQDTTPFKYSVLEGKLSGIEISHADNNINIDVPDSEATDVMNAETTDDGKTVGEVFQESMKDEWSELDKNDKRRQYYELLRAKSALTAGYYYLPYQTELNAFRTADTTAYLPNAVPMDQVSMYGLLDEEAIGNKLAELAEDPDIQKGLDGFMASAVGKIKNKDALTSKIYNTMISDEYYNLIESMEPDGARSRFSNDLKSLEYLDSSKAQAVRDQFIDRGIISEINAMMENGSYTQEALDLAIQDQVMIGLSSVWMGIFGTVFTDRVIQNYMAGKAVDLPEADRLKLAGFKDAYNILTNAIRDSMAEHRAFNIGDIAGRIKSGLAGVEAGTKGTAAVAIHGFMTAGVMPAIGGVLTMTAAAYSLAGNGGKTIEERMAAARMLLITAATAPAMATAMTTALGKAFNTPGMTTMLGLDSQNTQLRDAFLKRFPAAASQPALAPEGADTPRRIELPDTNDPQSSAAWADDLIGWLDDYASGNPSAIPLPEDPDAIELDDLYRDPNDRIAAVQVDQASVYEEALNNLPEAERATVMRSIDGRVENMGVDPDTLNTSSKLKIVGTLMNSLGALADTAGGILDVALGGMSIKKLIDDPDNATPAQYAAASFQIASGATIAGQAGTQLAAMLAGRATAAALGVASGVLGLAGVGFGAIAAIVTGVIAKQKDDRAAQDTRDLFNDLSYYGVTEKDWGDKLNYTIHSRYEYNYYHGSDRYYQLYPDTLPVWEARPEQYEDFTEYVAEHHNISDNWFRDWDKKHDSGIEGAKREGDPSGLPRFGDDGKPGTLSDFIEDIDRVDVGSIRLLDKGRVEFVKDGVRQVIDPFIGGEAGDKTRQGIIDYLTQLYDITHQNGQFDEALAHRIDAIFARTDDYNDLDALKHYLNPPPPPSEHDEVPSDPVLFGHTGRPGTFSDFREDIDRVDMASIRKDPSNDSVIYFKKDGVWQKLDKDDPGKLKGNAEKIFNYLDELYGIVRPNGSLDADLAARIDGIFGRTDDYNNLSTLRKHLGL